MSNIVLTKVEVDSVDITSSVISYTIEKSNGFVISSAEMKVTQDIASTFVTGQTLEIWRGFVTSTDVKKFDGYIESFRPEGGLVTIVAKNKLWDLVRKSVNHFYDSNIDASAGVISEIVEDLVTTYGGLTADGTTIQDSGTVVIYDKFECKNADIYERCKALAQILDWQLYYRDDTDKVYFEPKGYVTNLTILTVGDNIIEIPKWNYDDTEMANDVTIIGATQNVETTETGQIGVTTGFTTGYVQLLNLPISTKVYTDVSNPPTTLRLGGVEGSTSDFYYSVEKNTKRILPAPSTTFTTNWFFITQYTYPRPTPVHMYSQTSIDAHKTFSKAFTFDDVKTVDDAITRGNNILAKYSQPFVYADLKVLIHSTYDFEVGQSLTIIDNISQPTINKTMIINKVVYSYPANYDVLTVGDKEWRLADWQANIETQLKRLQEDNISSSDIIIELVGVDNQTLSPIDNSPRYLKTETRTASGTNLFILDNDVYGILGTNQLGDTGFSAEALYTMQQYNNDYVEDFLNTDFKDAGSTTATWGSGTLIFTAGQIGQSTTIDYNNGTITEATLTVTISSGTYTLYLSADGGSHWETTTSGVSHTFVVTGTDLRWKITCAGVGTITKVEVNDYH